MAELNRWWADNSAENLWLEVTRRDATTIALRDRYTRFSKRNPSWNLDQQGPPLPFAVQEGTGQRQAAVPLRPAPVAACRPHGVTAYGEELPECDGAQVGVGNPARRRKPTKQAKAEKMRVPQRPARTFPHGGLRALPAREGA